MSISKSDTMYQLVMELFKTDMSSQPYHRVRQAYSIFHTKAYFGN